MTTSRPAHISTRAQLKANCASEQKWGQPDWLQPNAKVVTAQLIEAAKHAWPAVLTHFDGSFESLFVGVNGANNYVSKARHSRCQAVW